MSKTPETDAASNHWGIIGEYEVVKAEFARTLEIERNAARMIAQTLRDRIEAASKAITTNPTKITLAWETQNKQTQCKD